MGGGRRAPGRVYIPRRDTSSWLNSLVGGRLFPGVHHHASFTVEETDDRFHVAMTSDDGSAHVRVDARLAQELPESSVFDSIDRVSRFFEEGSLGYSPAAEPDSFDGLELKTLTWDVQPLDVKAVESSADHGTRARTCEEGGA